MFIDRCFAFISFSAPSLASRTKLCEMERPLCRRARTHNRIRIYVKSFSHFYVFLAGIALPVMFSDDVIDGVRANGKIRKTLHFCRRCGNEGDRGRPRETDGERCVCVCNFQFKQIAQKQLNRHKFHAGAFWSGFVFFFPSLSCLCLMLIYE